MDVVKTTIETDNEPDYTKEFGFRINEDLKVENLLVYMSSYTLLCKDTIVLHLMLI